MKILLNTNENEVSQNNLNYNLIENSNDFENTFNSNKNKIYERVYDEGNNYISLIKNLMKINSNPFKINYKQIKFHKNWISYIDKLKDGRLITCSFDNSLNIYKNDSLELQLSIKEHKDWIHSFTQIKDERIITCSSDKKMK